MTRPWTQWSDIKQPPFETHRRAKRRALDGSRKRRGEARDSNYLVRHVQLTGERVTKIEKPEAEQLTATSASIALTIVSRSTSRKY